MTEVLNVVETLAIQPHLMVGAHPGEIGEGRPGIFRRAEPEHLVPELFDKK